jgi:hypothetical protein
MLRWLDIVQVNNLPLSVLQTLYFAAQAACISTPGSIVTLYPPLELLLKQASQDLPNDTNPDKYTETSENDITGQSRAVCMLLIRGRIRRGWY